MKIVIVRFDNTVDVSSMVVGSEPIAISDGTNTIVNGEIFGVSEVVDPDTITDHRHRVPEVETGQVITS